MDDKYTIKHAKGSADVDGSFEKIDANPRSYPLLFEMLRSFTTLASTLNLSHAVAELGSTRQTVRRHISQMEEIKGGPLFDVSARQYQLTDLGRLILPEALNLLAQAETWIAGQSREIDGLQFMRVENDDGWFYFQQEHPIGKAFRSTGQLLKQAINAWAEAKGDIEHEAIKAIRPYAQIFRRSEGDWLFTEVGEQSSAARLLGWKFARSTIGRSLGTMPGGQRFDLLAKRAYGDVERTQGLRLDHCYTVLPPMDGKESQSVCFERLLMGSWFADGSFAMLSVVRLTHDVEISGVSQDRLDEMPEEFVME